jgi:hypothetical protein
LRQSAGGGETDRESERKAEGAHGITKLGLQFRLLALPSRNQAMVPFQCSREGLECLELPLS